MSWYGFSCKEVRNTSGHHVGFVAEYQKNHATVTIKDACLQMDIQDNVSGVYSIPYVVNPYAFYKIFNTILRRLTVNYIAPPESMLSLAPPDKAKAWLLEKVKRYWCKAIHSEWRKLLSRMDKQHLDVARALFTANFTQGTHAGIFVLENINKVSKEHKQDIIDFVPCAMLADSKTDYFVDWSKGKNEHIFDLDVQELEEDEYDRVMEETTPSPSTEDWRGAYCHPSLNVIPNELTETLRAIKPGIAPHSVKGLKNVILDRVLTSKPEIVVRVTAVNRVNYNSFKASSKDNIVDSFKALKSEEKNINFFKKKISIRKTSDLERVTEVVDNTTVNGTQNMLRLTENFLKNFRKKSKTP